MKRLLICPKCRNNGIKNILAELKDDGRIIIERHHKNCTEIFGENFVVVCGGCKEPIFVRKESFKSLILLENY